MKLEQEAQEHIKSRRTAFLNVMTDHMENMEVLLRDNLWESTERDHCLKAYTSMYLWARQCAERHGVK